MLLVGKRLNGKQKQQFREALAATFDYDSLEQMLNDNFDIKVTDIIMPIHVNFPTILDKMLKKAERESWTAQLLQAALSMRSDDTQLITFARQFGPLLITPPLKKLVPQNQGFERVVTTATMHEYDRFLRGLWERGSQVCRIEATGKHIGTGFLVGPNMLMTCYHVWEAVQSSDKCICCFDYGSKSESRYYLTQNCKIDISRHNPEEGLPNGKTSTPDELDYALLHLKGMPGNDLVFRLFQEKPSQRGWITPYAQEYIFSLGSPLYILHYPQLSSSDGSQKPLPVTLKLSQEEHAIIENNGMRVKYTTNTESGSSGSPCFNASWELVAMHHLGDPNKPPQYNQGIPFAAIKKRVEQNHKGIFMPFSLQAHSGASNTNGHEASENTQSVPDSHSQNQVSPFSGKLPPPTQQESAVSTPPPAKRKITQRKPKKDKVSIDRSTLPKLLSKCPSGVFEMIIYYCNPPAGAISGSQASQATRTTDLLRWAEGNGGIGLPAVYRYYLQAMDIDTEKKTPRISL